MSNCSNERKVARKLRIQYPGALYHVINRGNFQRDVFETVGAAQAFEAALAEVCPRYDWLIHAYVIMRNHYHVALETPGANLVEGMHWLQSTFATRFNRYRAKHGHLFQGRYQVLLVEDASALTRVVHYINLNPVRAGIVQPSAVATFRWGSLRYFLKDVRVPWLSAGILLKDLTVDDTAAGWAEYLRFLAGLAGNSEMQQQMGFALMCRGWAIGTAGWRQAIAREYSQMALEAGFEREELREIKESRWRDELLDALRERGLSWEQIISGPCPVSWKIEVAARLRRRVAAPYGWIAKALNFPKPASLRMQIYRQMLHVSA